MSLRAHKRRRRAASGEDGFAIIEALVAALMLALVSVAIYDSYDAGTRATYRAQATQVELGQAQREMELVRSYNYDSIALTARPSHSNSSASPWYRVLNNGTFNLSRSGTPNYARMVSNGDIPFGSATPIKAGQIAPGPEHFTQGDVSGWIWRMVVWQKNSGCAPPTCSGQDIKRVIIIVEPDATSNPLGGTRGYLEIHSDFIDPQATSSSNVDPISGGSKPSAQQFYLSDSSCVPGAPAIHTDIVGNHPLHNTLSDCPSSQRTGTIPGAPDALLTYSPQGDPVADPTFDYESEFPSPDPVDDRGIQMEPQLQTSPSPQCEFLADGKPHPEDPNPQRRFHVWLSDEIAPGPPFKLTGPVTVSLFSKSLGGAQVPGTICLWLFERKQNGTDLQFGGGTTTSPAWTSPSNPWPSAYGDPVEIPVPTVVGSFDIGSGEKLTPHERLGVAVAFAGGPTRKPLELMYDHPAYPSYVSVGTSTPINP